MLKGKLMGLTGGQGNCNGFLPRRGNGGELRELDLNGGKTFAGQVGGWSRGKVKKKNGDSLAV